MALSNKQIGLLVVTGVWTILQPWGIKLYKKWVEDSPESEAFLVKITGGHYRRKARAKKQEDELKRIRDNMDLAKRVSNDEVGEKIESYLQTIRDVYHFHRATISDYTYEGEIFPEHPVESDFVKINVTITHESVHDNFRPIKPEWQNRSAAMFSKALYMLHYSEKGWISIGPKDSDDLTESQNMFGVYKCYRMGLDGKNGIFGGVLVMSWLYDMADMELSDEQIREIKLLKRKIFIEKQKYIS